MTISFARYQFPPAIIQHAVWLYVGFTLSYRDVEDLLVERGLDVSYETVRRWVLKFGPQFARELRRRRPRPTSRWHLDEMAVAIAGSQFWRRSSVHATVIDLALGTPGPQFHPPLGTGSRRRYGHRSVPDGCGYPKASPRATRLIPSSSQTMASRAISRRNSSTVLGGSGRSSGVRSSSRRCGVLRNLGLKPRNSKPR